MLAGSAAPQQGPARGRQGGATAACAVLGQGLGGQCDEGKRGDVALRRAGATNDGGGQQGLPEEDGPGGRWRTKSVEVVNGE